MRSFVFSIPMCLRWSWSNTCCCRSCGTVMCLPFITTLYDCQVILIRSVSFMSMCSWSLVLSQPVIIIFFRHWRQSSCAVACWTCNMDMHSGISVVLCMASTLMSTSQISSSLSLWWLCHDSQSAMNISGPGL